MNETSAPGKIILFGEHAVVYGSAAIACPIPFRVHARRLSAVGKLRLDVDRFNPLGMAASTPDAQSLKKLRAAFASACQLAGVTTGKFSVGGQVPMGMGLGSSAAVSVALSRLLQTTGKNDLSESELAHSMERIFHGKPSGLDAEVCLRESLIYFKRKANKVSVRSVPVKKKFSLLVWIVGKPRSTRDVVLKLEDKLNLWPTRYKATFKGIAQCVQEARLAIQDGNLNWLGDLMRMNQGYLYALGVSSPVLSNAAAYLESQGALGAKMSGAGGQGGCVIALFRNPAKVLAQLKQDGQRAFTVDI